MSSSVETSNNLSKPTYADVVKQTKPKPTEDNEYYHNEYYDDESDEEFLSRYEKYEKKFLPVWYEFWGNPNPKTFAKLEKYAVGGELAENYAPSFYNSICRKQMVEYFDFAVKWLWGIHIYNSRNIMQIIKAPYIKDSSDKISQKIKEYCDERYKN